MNRFKSVDSVKPHLTKGMVKKLRKDKWARAEVEVSQIEELGFPVIIFQKSVSTPHIRIFSVDYWPASTRFFDVNTQQWGVGFDNLKNYLVAQYKMGVW